jgi:hypothetical protein
MKPRLPVAAHANVASIGAAAPKPRTRAKPLVMTGTSVCFSDMRWSRGTMFVTFAKDNSQYDYDVDRATAKEWLNDPSRGGYFNSEIR